MVNNIVILLIINILVTIGFGIAQIIMLSDIRKGETFRINDPSGVHPYRPPDPPLPHS